MDRTTRAGFTLIELLVVIVIIGILVTIGAGQYSTLQKRVKERQTAANVHEINKALAAFGADNNGMYPFRIKYYNNATYSAPAFDPYSTAPNAESQYEAFYSLGLIGGVETVDTNGNYNPHIGEGPGPRELSAALIQPLAAVASPSNIGFPQWFYQVFNQYSDPLVAMGYMGAYPDNPFINRPMGNIAWAYGDEGRFYGGAPGNLNKTIPHPDLVYATPGDFCYTHFYSTEGMNVLFPEGVVESKKMYDARPLNGVFYLDMVDSYQLWGYGNIPKQGSQQGRPYGLYPRSAGSVGGNFVRGASKDWDNSGTKDIFEIGMAVYYSVTGGNMANNATDSSGNRVEF